MTRNYDSLQVGRGVAALLVLLSHVALLSVPRSNWNHLGLANVVFDFGHIGVCFFFVLSGFIMALVHGSDVGRPERFVRFCRNRFFRIYPIYWLTLALGLALNLFNSTSNMISSLVLISRNNSHDTLLFSAWTLYHEVSFYIVFALLILSRRYGGILATLWVGCILSGMAGYKILPLYLSSSINLLFGMGVIAQRVMLRDSAWLVWPTFILSIVGFVVVSFQYALIDILPLAIRNLCYGLAAMFLIISVTKIEKLHSLRASYYAITLGNASYSLYLTNVLMIIVIEKLYIEINATLLGVWPSIVVFVLCTGFGLAFHNYVEQPLTRQLRGKRRLALNAAPRVHDRTL